MEVKLLLILLPSPLLFLFVVQRAFGVKLQKQLINYNCKMERKKKVNSASKNVISYDVLTYNSQDLRLEILTEPKQKEE